MFEMIKQLQFNYKYYQFIPVLVLLQHESLLKCKKTGFFHLLFQPLPIFTCQKWPNPVQKKKQLENLFCNIIIMSKYKYEKEFMFSNKRLDEVQLFLENQENLLDLLAIRDINKNTVIHHTAYHNQTKVLELYLKYYRKNLQNQHRNLVQIKFQTRYLLDEPNSEGYTAVHYAVFRGNISVLKVLQKYEANFNLTNHLKMGVLHLAAQGDKLCSFLYMHNRKLDINIRDSKMSTPLHWAAFSGGQKVVQYLLAQKQIDIDPVDVEGFTPLHLATTYGNSKIAKKLLIAGADRQLMTTKGQTALQIAQQKQFNGIKRMLDENYTIKDRLKLLCNAKIKYRPETKSLLCALVFLLVTAVASLMSFWILEFLDLWAQIVQICVYLLALFLYLSLTFTGKKGENKPQNYALYAQNRRLYHLCLICVKQMNFRQRHCHICKACIPQYDHHCTWINNCVGKHNLFRFNLFLYVTLISLIWCGFLSVRVFVCLLRSQYDTLLFMVRPWFQQDGRLILLAVAVVIFLVFLVFGLPLIFLILVQAKNLLLGKTTYERFSKSQESLLTRQGSFLNLEKSRIQPSSASLRNCLNMCCEYENLSKQDREFSNSTSSSANRIVQ